jgi:two-component system nitrogen regulation sensor histidine kinase GlnL
MYLALLNSLNNGIMVLDAGGKICWANESACRIVSTNWKYLKNRKLSDFTASTQASEVNDSLADCVKLGHNFTYRELQLISGRAMSTTDASFSKLEHSFDISGAVLVELAEVDQILKIAREARYSKDEQSSKQLLRGLAHEIKNPLGGIKGAAQLLSKEADASIYQDYLEVIITETDRLTSLVDNLVGPNIRQANDSINIHRLLEQCRSLLGAQAGGKIDFQRDYDPSLPETTGSAQQLYQAILNITKNALEAVTESDTSLPYVRFSTRAIRRALPGSKGAHTMLRVRIEDNGPGIPEDLKERIFFPMVSGRAQGSGLGLSITQTIISRHRGWIEVESEPGHTAIDVMLPFGDMP